MNQKYQITIDFKPLKIKHMVASWKSRAEAIGEIVFSGIDFRNVLEKIQQASIEDIETNNVFFNTRERLILSEKLAVLEDQDLFDKISTLFAMTSDKRVHLNSMLYFMKNYSITCFNNHLKVKIPTIKLPDEKWPVWVREAETIFSNDPLTSICLEIIKSKIFFENIDQHFGLMPNSTLHADVLKKLFSMDLINYFQLYEPQRLIDLIQTKKYESVMRQVIDSGIRAYHSNALNDRSHVFYHYVKRNIGNPDEFKTKNLWMGISDDAKIKFREWLVSLEIDDFFRNIAGDHERLAYWKRQIKHITTAYKVVGRDDNNPRCLVMKIKQYDFFEFPAKGNALYVYKTGTMNYPDKVTNANELKQRERVVSVYNSTFGQIEGRVIHIGDWTRKVDALIRAAGK